MSIPGSSARSPGLLGFLVMVVLATAVASLTSQDSDKGSADTQNFATETQITSYPTDEEDPDWSPDGKWIAFASGQSGNKAQNVSQMIRPDP